MERDSIIYWAGFTDGEGHIALNFTRPYESTPRGHYFFGVWLTQFTDYPDQFFGELVEDFGGRIIAMKGAPNTYRWYIYGDNGRRFLETLLPYLRVKKRQAELGIALQSRFHAGRALQMDEIRARDAILIEYNKLIQVTHARRERRLGQHQYRTGKKKR